MNPDAVRGDPVFAVGTGRCGTHLLVELFGGECGVYACHESNPFNEAFHRYCQWNGLPVDDQGFLDIKRSEIESAGVAGKIFFEASAYLSLSIAKLFYTFGSRFILITRNPVDTVNSLWVKGWYDFDYKKQNDTSALGYHELGAPHHFFSRLVPKNDDFPRWKSLSRTGKLGWFWNMLHDEVLRQLQSLPKQNWRIVKLEELDYDAYMLLTRFVGIESSLSRQRFENVVSTRPGSLWGRRKLGEWTSFELREFAEEVTGVAGLLGYRTDFDAQWRRVQGGRGQSGRATEIE
jgi:hypothetical protein